MRKHRLEASQLHVGAPLHFDVFDADGRLLLRRGNRISSELQLERLIQQGIFSSLASEGDGTGLESGPFAAETEVRPRALHDASVFKTFDRCSRRLDELCNGPVTAGEAMTFMTDVGILVENIQRACEYESDASLAYILLGSAASYPVRQQINVAILTALMLGRVAPASLREHSAMAATLTMNIGMFALQEELYCASVPLSETQRATLRQHPDSGAQLLRQRGVDDLAWLEIVTQHHEALDGSGYPLGLKGEAICREAQIIAVADRYSGMVSERAYRPGLAPDVVLNEIHRRHARALDAGLIRLLIKTLGPYPPGTVVTLANKEVGVVTRRLLDLKHPIVRTFFVDPLWPYEVPRKRFTASMPQFAIAGVLPRSAVAGCIDPEQLWSPGRVEERDDGDG